MYVAFLIYKNIKTLLIPKRGVGLSGHNTQKGKHT